MKRKNLLSLFLCLVMLLSLFPVSAFAEETDALPEEEPSASSELSEELTPEDPGEEPVLPEETEVEEGVFHGRKSGEALPEGVYNTDYPEVVEFRIVEAGTTLNVGDTVHIRVKLSDNDGISYAYCYLSNSCSNYWSNGHHISLTQEEGTDWFGGTWVFSESDRPGDYFVPMLYAEDSHGFYTNYQSSSKRVMQRLLPGYVTLAGESQGPVVEGPPDFVFAENGQTLSPGDALHFSFTLPAGMQYTYIYLYLGGSDWRSIGPQFFTYDAETGAVTGEFPLSEEMYNGDYYVNEVSYSGKGDNGWQSKEWQFNYAAKTYRFTLTGATEPGSSETAISISEVSCDKDGQTLVDGDTVTVRFRVNSEEQIESASVYLRYCTVETWNNTGYYNGVNSRYLEAELNEDTGFYEASLRFGENDVYGVYTVSEINVHTENSYAYMPDLGIMFLFAEDPGTSITRLTPATNLSWSEDGHALFTLPADFSGILDISYYNAAGSQVQGAGWRLDARNADWTQTIGDESFLETDLPSGDYYFTVTLRGDGVNNYDSVPAKSGFFTYTAPETRLGTATELDWVSVVGGSMRGRFKIPAERENLGYTVVKWYFSETEDGQPEHCWSVWVDGPDAQGYAFADLPDYMLQEYGNGYYYYTVRLIRRNLLVRNSEESELSPAYNVASLANSVLTQLENIETEGKTPEEIREQIAAIPTQDLINAMLTDDDVAEMLEKLEAAVGSRTVVVSQNVPELASGVRAVGGGLNETITDGDVTLVIDRAENEEAIPGWCDEALSVRFSMNLENVADPENLNVPVLVDIPIPESFDYDRLVILHYHVTGGSPEVIYPYIYRAGNQYYAQFTVLRFSDFILTQELGVQPQFEPTTYLLLTEGERAKPALIDPSYGLTPSWYVTDENGERFASEEDAVLSVDTNGVVTALKPGTAYVVAELGKESRWYGLPALVRCRVDVIPAADEGGEELSEPVAAAVRQVTLLDTKATVELYRTDYAVVRVLPEMETLAKTQASIVLPDESFPPPADHGVAVQSARFTGTGSELFDAVVLDDRTIAVVPRESTLRLAQAKASNVKGSYSFGLELTMNDGSVYTAKTGAGADAALKLTVKKTLPKIKAKAVVFNSYYHDYKPIEFTGGSVIDAWLNSEKDPPSWLYLEAGTQHVQYSGPLGAKSGKGTLHLQVMADGWRVTQDVKVAVSYKNTPPTASFKDKTVTIKAGVNDMASVIFSIKPAGYPVYSVEVSRITEGKGKTLKTYENGTVLNVVPSFFDVPPTAKERGEVLVWAPYVDGASHTYTVYLSIDGKESSFTVKTLGDSKPITVKLSLDKTGKAIDLAIPKSRVIINATTGNLHTDCVELHIDKIVNKAAPDVDVKRSFHIMWMKYSYRPNLVLFYLTANSEDLAPGTYIATVTCEYNGGLVQNTISFAVKRSAKVPTPTLKLTAKGSIDVLNPDWWSWTEIQAKMTNYYDYELSPEDLTITRIYDGATKQKVSEDVTDCFEIVAEDEYYYLTLRPGTAISHADKYTVQSTVNGIASKPVSLKIIQSKPKVTQSTKTVTLLRNDRLSQGELFLSLAEVCKTDIREVKLVSPTDKAKVPYFDLVDLGGGFYAIKFHDNQVSVTKTQTVKLQVFLEGNQTSKPNATLTVKVEIR